MAFGTAKLSAVASWLLSVHILLVCILPIHFHNISRCIDEPMYVLSTSFPTAEAFGFKSAYQIFTMTFGSGLLK